MELSYGDEILHRFKKKKKWFALDSYTEILLDNSQTTQAQTLLKVTGSPHEQREVGVLMT